MPDGTPATTQITLGYDPAKKRFVGTWLGSMMTHLWIYDGELSADERTLTLSSEGPQHDRREQAGELSRRHRAQERRISAR